MTRRGEYFETKFEKRSAGDGAAIPSIEAHRGDARRCQSRTRGRQDP